jgi:hypothetical protein
MAEDSMAMVAFMAEAMGAEAMGAEAGAVLAGAWALAPLPSVLPRSVQQ